MSYEEYKKELETKKGINVASHTDADGVYSLALANLILDIDNYIFPDKFGDYLNIPGDPTRGEESIPIDLALDLGAPISEEYTNYVIDHHPHPDERKYKLIHMYVPTGLILYNLWKDKIPKEKLWLVAGSLTGDGQPELIPEAVFGAVPSLLDRVGSIYKSYGKFKLYDYPLYLMLSSPINALCRIGNPLMAFKLAMSAKDPLDIIENPSAQDAKEVIRKEEDRIFKDDNSFYMLGSSVVLYKFNSKFGMTGLVASKLSGENRDKTIVVVNESTKSLSIRGHLADYLRRALVANGFTVGGHAGYMGGELGKNQTIRDLIYALRGIV